MRPVSARKKELQKEDEEKLLVLEEKRKARIARTISSKPIPKETQLDLANLNTRAVERIKSEFPALVICETDNDTIAKIIDISPDGVRLRFAAQHYLPETVLLDSPAFDGFVVANVAWQSGNEAGLSFDHEWTKKISSASVN